MEYWISSKDVQMGPYTLEQLQLMWQGGQLTSDTYYYDSVSAEWRFLRKLVENVRDLFTVEEAFVRLGQNRQRGCLSVFNKEETLHLFVEGGFVVSAIGEKEQGEFALSRAIGLEEAAYAWIFDAKPPAVNLRVNIAEYAMKHAIARDVRIANTATRKHNTVALPKNLFDKIEVKSKFNFFLEPEETPTLKLRLAKMNNVVGREDHCDVVVNDQQVSRKHCLLEVWEESVKVKDLDSSNGTFVNGVPVRDGYLRTGDELALGSYKLILHKEQKMAPDMG